MKTQWMRIASGVVGLAALGAPARAQVQEYHVQRIEVRPSDTEHHAFFFSGHTSDSIAPGSATISVNIGHDMGNDAWAGIIFLPPSSKASSRVAASVEPGSPAQQAGIVAGDTILSFNNVPMSSVVKNPKKFKPGDHVTVQYRRGGPREVSFVLARRPVRWLSGRFVTTPQVPIQLAPGQVQQLTQAMFEIAIGCGGGNVPVAGAQLAAMNADLAEAFSIGDGVLVLQVVPGTPAKVAGLRGGDVLVSVDSVTLDAPATLIKVMERNSGTRTVTLVVKRAGKTRTVPLKW